MPVPTIKYYLREGLLHPGEATAPNQASYDATHAHRVRLVRVLREVGGLGVEAIRGVLAAVDDPSLAVHELLGVAHRAIAPTHATADPRDLSIVDELLERIGWEVTATAPDRNGLAQAVASLRALGRDVDASTFLMYAEAADRLAEREIATVGDVASRADAVEQVVVGTLVYEQVFAALRRLAHEHYSGRRDTAGRGGA